MPGAVGLGGVVGVSVGAEVGLSVGVGGRVSVGNGVFAGSGVAAAMGLGAGVAVGSGAPPVQASKVIRIADVTGSRSFSKSGVPHLVGVRLPFYLCLPFLSPHATVIAFPGEG